MSNDDESSDPSEPIEGTESITLRVNFDLIPEWSNTLERIARHHAVRVVVGIDGDALGVKIAIRPEQREHFLADVQRYWDMFVERRKREGRWDPR